MTTPAVEKSVIDEATHLLNRLRNLLIGTDITIPPEVETAIATVQAEIDSFVVPESSLRSAIRAQGVFNFGDSYPPYEWVTARMDQILGLILAEIRDIDASALTGAEFKAIVKDLVK